MLANDLLPVAPSVLGYGGTPQYASHPNVLSIRAQEDRDRVIEEYVSTVA